MKISDKGSKPGPRKPEDLERELRKNAEMSEFLVLATRTLLQLIKEFAHDIEEIDSGGFKSDLSDFSEKIKTGDKPRPLAKEFEKKKTRVFEYIKQQKGYIAEKEQELRDIIDLLTKAMSTLDSDNQDYNRKIYAQSEKIEKITLLDDIKKIKKSLVKEISVLRETIRDKEKQDQAQIDKLTRRVSVLNEELEKTKEESLRDGLTGIYNRKAFDTYIREQIDQDIITNSSFSLMILDIDHFKNINDTFGHPIGDRVLVAAATKLGQFIRSQDFLARYGGEEFAIILPGASLRNAMKKAKYLCREIASARYAVDATGSSGIIKITVSIGVSRFRKGDTVESVTQRADQALYIAKNSGKNQAVTEKKIKAG